MRILITGGSGTIGTYVLRELLGCGHALTSFGRTPPVFEPVSFIRGGIADRASLVSACAGSDAVVHLAAVTSPYRADAETVLETNVMGTVRVLEAAVETGISKVVFASSGAATGFSFQVHEREPRFLPLDERHPCEPEDSYGLSKLLGEMACARWTRSYGLRTLCLRINHVWYVDRDGAEIAVRCGWARGLAVDELWERYRRQVLDPERKLPEPGPPLPRHLLFAVTDGRDAAQAFRLAVENDTLSHEVFQINGAETCSLRKTAELVAEHFPLVPVREPLLGYASLISHAKATMLLGYEPRHSWRESDFGRWLAATGFVQP